MRRNGPHIVIDNWNRLVCLVQGHRWKVSQGFPGGRIRMCLRCPAVEVER